MKFALFAPPFLPLLMSLAACSPSPGSPDGGNGPVEIGVDARAGELDAAGPQPDATLPDAGDSSPTDAGTDAPDGSPRLDGAAERDAATDGGPIVELSLGRLRGRAVGTTHTFEGIAYARPPVGKRRFAFPQPAPAWEGVRVALTPGPVCPHVGEGAPVDGRTGKELQEDEDCLTLNVAAPANPPADGAPVMVFIHGGSGNTGAGSLYDPRHLSEAGNVVVVTLNYRLGTLAWLVHPDLDAELGAPSGNLGLRDQQLALRWVRQHIASFGGDPDNVTLFGQSHGASCTCFHMFASGSEGLAHRFILQSGGCVGSAVTPGTREGMERRSDALIDELCANEADVLACLRARDAKELSTLGTQGLPLRDAQGIYVDGQLLEDLPRNLLEAGDYAHAPLLLGSTLHENDFLASEHFGEQWPLVNDTASLIIALSAMYPDDWLAILDQYGVPGDEDANAVMVDVLQDSWMRCTTRALGLEAARQGDDVFAYSFDLPPAVHIQDLDYVFGLDDPYSKLFEGAPVPLVSSLVEQMQGYWVRFAREGDPNGAGAPRWPPFTPEEDRHLVLDREITTGTRHLEDECDFWAGTVAGGS